MKQSRWSLFKDTMFVRIWSLFKVPLLFLMSPVVKELNNEKCVIAIPFRFLTKNHFKAMYMGVLVGGADIASGLLATHLMKNKKKKCVLAFKDISAKFLKRAEGKTFFICCEGARIQEMVEKAMTTGERCHMTVKVEAFCPDKLGDEPVAQFEMTLSVKEKK